MTRSSILENDLLRLTASLAFVFLTLMSNGQCFENGWSHPKLQGNTLRCVHAFGSVAYTGGDAGTVLKSVDGGVSWSDVRINTPFRILGIHFTDSNTGYATTRQGVYKTTDGGSTWNYKQLSTSSWMYDVQFVSDSIGVICGQNGLIYRTTDAGATWGTQHSWSSRHLRALHFPDPLNGYAVGGENSTSIGGKVLKTTDGGITWTNFTPLNQKINDVFFTSAQKGFCVTDFGGLISTTDGGANWTVSNLGNRQLLGIQFASPDSGIAVGLEDPWITVDGGTTWNQVSIPGYTKTYWALSTPSIGQHILVGAAGQIMTGSNLLSTTQVRTTGVTSNTIYDIIFRDGQNGMACGTGALVMHTSDGGASWQKDSTWAFGQNYLALEHVSGQTAFMSGTGGQIWKTTDWGQNWQQQMTSVNNQFFDMSFVNQDTGFVVGTNGILMRTLNSGNTWTTISVLGTTNLLNSVHFNTKGIGWIVGDNGSVYKSIDFGSTWQSAFFGNSSDKEVIVFFNDSIGYTGGSTGTIYYTHDGGATWAGGSITNGSGVKSILPLSANEAIGVGGFGDHYHTIDTGKTWIDLPLVTGNLLYQIYARDSAIWVTGSDGTILKSGFRGAVQIQLAMDICSGDSILVGSNWTSVGGIFYDTIQGQCDSIFEYTIQVRNASQAVSQTQICLGDSIFLRGAYRTTAGSYVDTLTNQWGCDSLLTTILAVSQPSSFTYADTLCFGDTLLFFNQMLTTPGSYQSNGLSNAVGCDSIVILNLNVRNPVTGIDVQTACDSYTWIDGDTYTTSNTNATYTFTNTHGCDSIVTLNLVINNSSAQTQDHSACDVFTWIDGVTYTASTDSATWLLTSSKGCDSLITLNLDLGLSSSGVDVQSACNSFTWIDGITYTASNDSATWTLTNSTGCDSLVRLQVNITNIDRSVIQNGPVLTANMANASYQWLDCDQGYSAIIGETNQNFAPLANGSYAVEITQNSCVDTSNCFTITSVGRHYTSNFESNLNLFENPTDGNFSIDLGRPYSDVSVTIYDITGKLVHIASFKRNQTLELQIDQPAGSYLVKVESGDRIATLHLIKK